MNQKNITITDIAKELGISKATVSRTISGKGRISTRTKDRVLSYVNEHGYRPNKVAQGLAKSKTYNVGVTLPGDYNLVELLFVQSCLVGICCSTWL